LFERILVPIDLADANEELIEAIAGLASVHKSVVTFLHVIPTVEHVPFDALEEFYDKLQAKAESNRFWNTPEMDNRV